MWLVVGRWLLGSIGRQLLLEYGWRIVATLAVGLVMLVATVLWSLSIFAQPGGMYWLASQASPELEAQHPLSPVTAAGVSVSDLPTFGPTPTPEPSVGSGVSDRVQFLIAQARSWLSPKVPYAWGGCSRAGVDCSCFVQIVLATIGVHVPRTTVEQKAFDHPVSRDQLQAGDTVFFDNTCTGCGANPTHEGLYIGNGQMIDAGDPVQVESIDTAHWRSHFDSAGRPPGL